MDNEKIIKLQQMIDESENIVFFGGAGVSTESGIPDFRSADGIYMQKAKYPPEEIISHSFYLAHPEEFFEFYKKYFYYPDAKPNAAHLKIAELEKAGKELADDAKAVLEREVRQQGIKSLRHGSLILILNEIKSSRLDTTALKKAHPDIAQEFLKQSSSVRYDLKEVA